MSNRHFYSRVADWHTDHAPISALRTRVFVREQQVSVDLEWDGLDARASHFLLECDHKAIACARVTDDQWQEEPALHIGRVAVYRAWRRRGAGTALMNYILDWCKETPRRHKPVFLHAQKSVIPFYQRLNFSACGADFLDAGIVHRAMVFHGSTQPNGACDEPSF